MVVTKDRDFRDSHLLRREPRRLVVVATSNISNHELLALFTDHLATLVAALGGAQVRGDRLDWAGYPRRQDLTLLAAGVDECSSQITYPNTADEKALAASDCMPGSRCW